MIEYTQKPSDSSNGKPKRGYIVTIARFLLIFFLFFHYFFIFLFYFYFPIIFLFSHYFLIFLLFLSSITNNIFQNL